MVLESGEHLSSDQISSLVEGMESRSAGGLGSDHADAQEHLANCGLCASRVTAQQRVAQAMRNLEVAVESKRSALCPDDKRWFEVAGGLVSREESVLLLSHAATCTHCGPLLRQATEDLGIALSPEEEAAIAKLPSASAEWQHAMSLRLTREAQGTGRTTPVSEQGWQHKLLGLLTGTGGLRWGFAAAGLLVVGTVGAWWIVRTPRLSTANQLIALAYSEQRTVALRLPDVPYAHLHQARGETGARELPKALLDAEDLAARGLRAGSDKPEWLRVNGVVALMGGRNDAAVESFESALAAQPNDIDLKVDLAAAYFERSNYNRALDLLNQVLANDPRNRVALFDRALVLQTEGNMEQAIGDWRHYLELDSTSAWAQEARQKLQQAENSLPPS